MSLYHQIEMMNTPSYTDRETCKLNITVFPLIHDVEEIPSFSIPSFSFSFDELVQFPRRCKDQFEEHLLRMQQPLLKHTTREFLADTIFKYAVNLAFQRAQVIGSVGCVVEAGLFIVHLRLADVERGMFKGGDGEEVITCPVCLEDLASGMEFCKLPCSHMFHSDCIDRWCETNKTCPYCRYELKYEKIIDERLVDLLGLNDIVEGMASTRQSTPDSDI